MDIRRADRGDQVAIGNLILPWDRDNGPRYKDGRGRVSEREFVAEDADGIVGWISGQHDARVWQFLAAYEDQPDNWACSLIVKFFVQKERRRQDIGADLLAFFERDAQDAGRDLVVVSPDEKGEKERLLSFYRKHGYEYMDPCSDYSTRPPWFMAKSLPVLR
ncbi:GNAT family N-acetyltransferase [Arthrobacter sp. NPDC093128]|uniref:GNAT family N-acetyltransferase n=1 Tax=Arthrobacter sp. NPDC093128 TaxID=3154979 RepID=UPI00344146A6